MAKDMPIFILAFCWAHVRRDFIDAARRFPEKQGWMFDWVEKIRELYQINKDRLAVWDKDKPLQQQSKLFSEQQKKLVKALSLMEQQRDEYLRNEELPAPQKAVLSSLKNHWPGLLVFVDHPQVSMDNNVSERGVRKGVNGRKNYYGSGSQWSADLMAGMLTLLQTILHWGINPRHWITLFLSACAENDSNPPSDLSPFLPWEMDEKRKELLSRPIPNDTS
jgi:transposase